MEHNLESQRWYKLRFNQELVSRRCTASILNSSSCAPFCFKNPLTSLKIKLVLIFRKQPQQHFPDYIITSFLKNFLSLLDSSVCPVSWDITTQFANLQMTLANYVFIMEVMILVRFFLNVIFVSFPSFNVNFVWCLISLRYYPFKKLTIKHILLCFVPLVVFFCFVFNCSVIFGPVSN